MKNELEDEEEQMLRSVTLQNAQSILFARQRAEQELIEAKEALERKTVELAHSLAMMRATLESTTDGILVTDRSGNIITYNENFLKIWQFPREVSVPENHRQILELTHCQFKDQSNFLSQLDEVDTETSTESFHLLETIDGRYIERSSRIKYVDGQNTGRVWSFRDISKRRRAEEALRDETRDLELLNQTGKVIASTLDLKILVQEVTDAATQLSGAKFGAFFYTAKNDSGQNMQLYVLSGAPREAFDKYGSPRATALFGPTFQGAAPIRIDDVSKDPRYGTMSPHYGLPNGHLTVRSYLAVPVLTRMGTVSGGLFFGHPEPGVFTDRSERIIVGIAAQAAVAIDNARLYEDMRRASEERKQLLDAERLARIEAERISIMKDEFLATISHELRTPLNSILGWAQILQSNDYEPEDLEDGLASISRNAKAQTQLVEDLLDMSRFISGKVRLDIQDTELIEIIEAALASVRPSAEVKNISLQKKIMTPAAVVAGDPNRLQQVVWNLLSNAIKFTTKNGRVNISLSCDDIHAEIIVEDTGVGIHPEFQPYIFDRFRQADSSSTRKHGGLGLGLSIAKQLVELHAGTIKVISQGVGQGTTFVVNLPLATANKSELLRHKNADLTPTLANEKIDLEGIKILVIDDEADARDLIKRVLLRNKALIFTAVSAYEGLEILMKQRPDLIISDIGMPKKDGYQFMRDVRSLSAGFGGKTPAIALTAFARSEDRTRAMLAGFQSHLAKPIEPLELIATVASLTKSFKAID